MMSMINRIITAKSVGVSVSGESGRVVVGLVDGLTAYHCRLPLPPLFCAPAKPATVGSGLHAASILCAALPAKEEKRWDERKPRPTQRPHHEPILRYPRTPLVVTIYNRHEERGETRGGFPPRCLSSVRNPLPLFCAPAKPATVGSGLHAASILCAALPAKEEKRWDERKPRPTQRPHHEPILRYPRTPLVVTIYNRHEERGETRTGFCRLFGFVIGGSGGLALFCLFMVVINRLFLFIVQGFHITMRIAK